MSSEELRLFDKVRVYLDEDYSSAENFTVSMNYHNVSIKPLIVCVCACARALAFECIRTSYGSICFTQSIAAKCQVENDC